MSDEEEILTQKYMAETEAWSAHDVDRILEASGGAGAGLGFGYRFRDARVGGTVEEQREALTAWLGQLIVSGSMTST